MVGPLRGGGGWVKPPEPLRQKNVFFYDFKKCPEPFETQLTTKNVPFIFSAGQNRSTEKCYDHFFANYLEISIHKFKFNKK